MKKIRRKVKISFRLILQYSPFEADALGIVWFLTKEDYYTRGAQNITIYNDAKNMESFMRSDINNVKNPRLFKMLEKTMIYNFDVEYKPGKEMAVADFGTRSPST